jgi:hypothetical protein
MRWQPIGSTFKAESAAFAQTPERSTAFRQATLATMGGRNGEFNVAGAIEAISIQ